MVSIIVDGKILLRTYDVADVQELFEAINNSRRHLSPWLDWVSKTTKPEHSLQFVQQSAQQLNNQEALALGIFYDGKIIGGLGMHDWHQETKRAQIGYWICPEQEGKGIVSQCIAKFIDHLFGKIGLNKIEIHFVQANKRSAHVASRLGFKIEGIIRQYVMRNGMPEDLVIAGLLRSEWGTSPKPSLTLPPAAPSLGKREGVG